MLMGLPSTPMLRPFNTFVVIVCELEALSEGIYKLRGELPLKTRFSARLSPWMHWTWSPLTWFLIESRAIDPMKVSIAVNILQLNFFRSSCTRRLTNLNMGISAWDNGVGAAAVLVDLVEIAENGNTVAPSKNLSIQQLQPWKRCKPWMLKI